MKFNSKYIADHKLFLKLSNTYTIFTISRDTTCTLFKKGLNEAQMFENLGKMSQKMLKRPILVSII